MTGVYRAWLSDHDNDAYCRVAGLSGGKGSDSCDTRELDLGPYIRTDGFPVAENLDTLIDDGLMYSAIQFDEFGRYQAGFLNAWTGSDDRGQFDFSLGSCRNWDSGASGDNGGYGNADATTHSWSSGNQKLKCDQTFPRLLCFQTSPGDTVLPTLETIPGKTVFVTSASGTGDLSSWEDAGGASGIEAGNNICRTLAKAAELDNAEKFKVWLSVAGDGALGRLQYEGAWVRPDGVLFSARGSLFNFSTITQTEKGDYIADRVWTGTLISGDCPSCTTSDNCDGWTSDDASQSAITGYNANTASFWTNIESPLSCDRNYRLYCFEDE